MKKILNKFDLLKVIHRLKKEKKKIVLCHGVFDLIHLGHINHFKKAKEYGDILIVSITRDIFVKKGFKRPYFNETQRLKFLDNIEIIDYIYLCASESAEDSINLIKPNFYIKGQDYKNNKLDKTKKIYYEKKLLAKFNGKIIYTKEESFSSTTILNENFPAFNEAQRLFIDKLRNDFSYSTIKNIFNKLSKLKVLVIGEAIIDRYNFGKVLGKSSKEPYFSFVSKYIEEYYGGSLAICNNISDFVKKIDILTSLEKNKENFKILSSFSKSNKTLFNFNPKNIFKTIIKERFIDHISLYKIFGNYKISEIQEDSFYKNLIKIILSKCSKYDIVIVSDYSHGLLDNVCSKTICNKSNFLSVNTQLNSSNIGFHTVNKYKNFDLLVVNESELRMELRDNLSDAIFLGKKIKLKNKIKNIIITQGGNGLSYLDKNNRTYRCPAFANSVKDKVGAGDAMLAMASILLKINTDPNLMLFLSSIASAKIVENFGNKNSVKLSELDRFVEYTFK